MKCMTDHQVERNKRIEGGREVFGPWQTERLAVRSEDISCNAQSKVKEMLNDIGLQKNCVFVSVFERRDTTKTRILT